MIKMTEFSEGMTMCMGNLSKLTESELEILMDKISQEKNNRKRKALQSLTRDAEKIFSQLVEIEPLGAIKIATKEEDEDEYEEIYFPEILDSLRRYALSLR
jgi:hypothetical protein